MTSDDVIRVLQALLTPVIGLTTIYIAYQQYRLARDKRRAELYEKRLVLFRQLKEFAYHVSCGRPNPDRIVKAREASLEVPFLFGREIRKYVDDLTFGALDLSQIQAAMRGDGTPEPKKKEYEAMQEDQWEKQSKLSNLAEQIDEMFHPYLKQDFR